MPFLNKFKLGCDPEFVVIAVGGGIFNLTDLLEHDGEIGWDHDGRVAEIRPAPKYKAYSLIRQMKQLLQGEELSEVRNLKWRAGAIVGTDTLGGHVHFGLVHDPYTVEYKVRVKALDQVTRCLEDLDILPAVASNTRRRMGGGYGRFGDTRPSGEDNHLEYRSMASWLYSPINAFVCLTLAKLAAFSPESFKNTPTSVNGLAELVRPFAKIDEDSARLLERVFEKGLKVQSDPEADVKVAWKELGF